LLDSAALLTGAYFSRPPAGNVNGEKLEVPLGAWTSDYIFGFFGGPIIHLAHGEWQHSLASLGARALLGPLGSLPGSVSCVTSVTEPDCSSDGATLGLLGGAVLVDLFDAFVLGYGDAEPEPKSSAGTRWPSVSVGPGGIAIAGRLP
jgi:hypothetical protein